MQIFLRWTMLVLFLFAMGRFLVSFARANELLFGKSPEVTKEAGKEACCRN